MYDAVPGYRDKSKGKTIRLESIDSFRAINNYVLVLIENRHDKLTYKTLTLDLDTSYEPGIHAENRGIVVKCPDKFIFPKNKRDANDSDWDTDIEIEEGDEVWFDYLTGMECNKIECDDKLYYALTYNVLYMAKRGEQVIPLNGYVLLEPIIEKKGYKAFKFEREVEKYAIVAYAGSCNKRYRTSKNKSGIVNYHDDPEVKAGCKIIYGMAINLWLEREEHSSFNGNKRYRLTQRRFLTGIVEEG